MSEPNVRAFAGPLRVSPTNSRYFTDESGRPIYLTGSHTWANLVDILIDGEPIFEYGAYLEFMQSHNHNFMRMWTFDHPEMAPWTDDHIILDPMPHARTGPELALDGKPKFDLGQWHQPYFDRLRERVVEAANRGIYVAVMLFEGWCVKWALPTSDPWLSHPYNLKNNVNGVDGDTDGDGKADVYSLEAPAVVEYQKAYIRKVIDTLNDQDHVMWEIINEIPNDERGVQWQYHMIDYIRDYERALPKQHPIGMTSEGGDQDNEILFASPADWISPGNGTTSEYKFNPPDTGGRKVVLTDTDHLWGHGGTYRWVWQSFLRGLNPIFMDPWCPVPGRTRGGESSTMLDHLNRPDYPDWEPLRANMGYTREYAGRINLNRMLPAGELSSSGYCLADPGREYLVYLPDDARVILDLAAVHQPLQAEWFSPRTGERRIFDQAYGSKQRTFISPFGLDSVLYLRVAEG